VRVAAGDLPKNKLPQHMPLDALNLELRNRFFPPAENPYAPHNDEALIKTFPDVVQTVFVEQKKNIGTSHSSAGTQFPSFGYMGQM